MSKAELVIKKLGKNKKPDNTAYTKYVPGEPVKDSKNQDILDSTALSERSAVHFDPNENFGGHTINRYGTDDKLEQFKITHQEASHLLKHLKSFSGKEKSNDSKKN